MSVPAVTTLQAEHRSLAAVLDALAYLVDQGLHDKTGQNLSLLRLILDYIEGFPDRYHHPKEDELLFPRIRTRVPEAAALLDRLGVQHLRGAELLRALRWELTCNEQGAHANFEPFARLAHEYVNFYLDHMRTEEHELLPLARKSLTAADWAEIGLAFDEHVDPLADANRDAGPHVLFEKILRLAPPPIGVEPVKR